MTSPLRREAEPPTTSEVRPPNVLVIVSDQHRADCLGSAHDYPVATPHLDRLAQQGIRFSNAFTPIPLCVPARQALLNGRRPESFGGLWNYDNGPLVASLSPTAYSWSRALASAGYASTYLGKWHVNPDEDPTSFGYDRYVGLRDYEQWRRQNHPTTPLRTDWFGAVDPAPLAATRTHWMADRAAEAITAASRSDQPWHVRVDFLEPHLPCTPAEPFASRYGPHDVPQWRGFADPLEGKPYIQRQQRLSWGVESKTWEDWAPTVARYYAVISQLDDAIGRILTALDSTAQQDNTIVIYTSDHGDLCGSHGMMDKHYVMYDDVVRVPLIVRWPDRIAAGSHSDAFVLNALDLAPTIAAAAGVEPPTVAHGHRLFDGDEVLAVSDSVQGRRHVISTYNGQQFGLYTQRMIRTHEWKYIWNATDVDELYDLTADPAELVNRIADDSTAAIVADLRHRLYAELVEQGDRLLNNAWLRRQVMDGAKLSS